MDREVDRDVRSRLKGQDWMERCRDSWLEISSREGDLRLWSCHAWVYPFVWAEECSLRRRLGCEVEGRKMECPRQNEEGYNSQRRTTKHPRG